MNGNTAESSTLRDFLAKITLVQNKFPSVRGDVSGEAKSETKALLFVRS